MKKKDTKQSPIFKPIFGNQWQSLPPALRLHYSNRAFSDDVVVAEGRMDIKFAPIIQLFSPIFKILGVLVPYEGTNIKTRVYFRSNPDSNIFCFDRVFYFPDRAPYKFVSRMTPQKSDATSCNEVIEYMGFGIGWHCIYGCSDNIVTLRHKRYVIRIFGINIPLPLELLFGRGDASEEATSENSFKMRMEITHRLWGKIYEYKGHFTIS